jgi:hypothetical protein
MEPNLIHAAPVVAPFADAWIHIALAVVFSGFEEAMKMLEEQRAQRD